MAELPNLLVIGAMKCGTSSLHAYLDLHPQVAMSRAKELNFFLPADAGTGASLLAERSSRDRGVQWYASQFADAPIRGESSVAYSFPWFPRAAADIAATLGTPRLVYVVRDPIERMLSHRDQFARRDPRPVAEALLDGDGPYLRASRYATALAPFIEQFGRQAILIVDQARLRRDRGPTVAGILEFLGLDPQPVLEAPALAREENVGAGKGPAFRIAETLRASRAGAAVADRLPRALRARAADSLRSGSTAGTQRLAPDVRRRILESLEPEIAGIESLTGWNLSAWRQP